MLRRGRMKFKQRALSLLLSIAMVLTFMPALTFADDDPADENGQPEVTETVEEAEPAEEPAPAEEAVPEEEPAPAEEAPAEEEPPAVKAPAEEPLRSESYFNAYAEFDQYELDENGETTLEVKVYFDGYDYDPTFYFEWFDADDNELGEDTGAITVYGEGDYYCLVSDNEEGLNAQRVDFNVIPYQGGEGGEYPETWDTFAYNSTVNLSSTGSATLRVNVEYYSEETPELTYKWYSDYIDDVQEEGTVIAEGTITNSGTEITVDETGEYCCIVSEGDHRNVYNYFTVEPYTKGWEPFSISTTIFPGETADLEPDVYVDEDYYEQESLDLPEFTYKWYSVTYDDEGEETKTLISNERVVADAAAGDYEYVVTDNYGNSDSASAYINEYDSRGGWIAYKEDREFRLNDEGEETLQVLHKYYDGVSADDLHLSYAWYDDDENLIEEATGAQLTVYSEGWYYCEISDGSNDKSVSFCVYGDGGEEPDEEHYGIWLNNGDTWSLWSDGSAVLTADCSELDNAEIPYDLEFKVSVRDDFDDDSTWNELSGGSYYTVDGNRITLHGAAIWEAVASFEDPSVRVDVTAFNKSGDELAYDWFNMNVMEARIDYLADLFSRDGTELTGSFWCIRKDRTGYSYSGNNEDGEEDEFEYQMLSFKVNGTEPEYDRDEEAWLFYMPAGENVISFTHKVYDPATRKLTDEIAEEQVTVTGVSDKYYIYLEGEGNHDILPGETTTFKTEGEHYFMRSGDEECDYNFKYKWELTKGAEYATITKTEAASDNSWSKITVKAKENIPQELLEDGDIKIEATVHLVVDNNTVASESEQFWITGYYEELLLDKDGKTLDEYMAVGTSVTVTPVLKLHRYVDGKPVVSVASDVEYAWYFDPADLEIKNGSKIISDYETRYKGSFTVKRKSAKEIEWNVEAYMVYDEDEGYEYAKGYYGWMAELYSFKSPQVTGIQNKVYNGKAQTQSIGFSILNPYDNYESRYYPDDGDYKITYSNNIKVGTATVEIVGLREFSGSKVTKTFKINPKGTSIKKLTKGKKSFTVQWKKQTKQTTGYQIQYGLKKNFKKAKTKTIKKNKTTKVKIKKLKKKKTYYVRIRTYKTVNGKKYYSAWSKAMKVKTK